VHAPQECNVLLVSVLQARGLPDMDHGDSVDSFVEVTCGSVQQCTPVVKRSLSPLWNWSHAFEYDPAVQELTHVTAEVFAKGYGLVPNEYIGQVGNCAK
jgi:C2 domain